DVQAPEKFGVQRLLLCSVPFVEGFVPGVTSENVLSSAFIPVSANKYFVRGALYILLFLLVASAAAISIDSCTAREDPLQEAVTALANEILSIRNLQSPLRLDWRNESSLPAAESAILQDSFAAKLTAARDLRSEDSSAPPLRVALHDTV